MASDSIVIKYEPRPQFVPFHEREERWSCMICHRRAGKTTACLMDMLDHACSHPGGRYAYIAPLRNQAKTVAWDMLKAFAKPVLKGGPNEAELRVDLLNGARITLFGADNPDALRGQAFDGVVLDEYADMPPSLFSAVVRPALSDRKGFGVIIGTVKGRNWLWQAYEQARIDDAWYTAFLRASETHLIDEDELADAKKLMSEEHYASEFECDPYAAIQGAFYGKYIADAESENRIRDERIHVPGFPVHTAWDLGIGASSMVIWFWQVIGNEIRVLDYIEGHGKGFEYYVNLLSMREYKYGKDYVPHDARVHELGTGKTRVETLAELGRNPELVTDHKVEDGINAVRLMLPKCWFDSKQCEAGLEALRQYRSDYDERKRIFVSTPRKDWTCHAADAFRYMAMAWRSLKAELPKEPYIMFEDLTAMTYDSYEDVGKKRRKERI